MGITLTPEQKSKLKREDSLILDLPGADGVDSAVFHNPDTGKEYPHLPVDAYHLTRYLRRGLRMGPAPAELKEAWLAGAEARKAADDASVSTYRDSEQGRLDREDQSGQFNEAVTAAVTQVLEKLGVNLDNAKAETPAQEKRKEVAPEGVQSDFFKTVDDRPKAPSTDGSAASRPDLHLVG